ncbi:MAG: exodeoxyribonuclease VII large subunit [Bacilli bacterium]|nr:exodeoxyribonuclease VII large subunit [Bacilli bacterium]
MNNEYITVSDINKIIKYTIEQSYELRSVYLKGEISNIKYHGRGHLYFSLKDESSKINAVMFNYKNAGMNFNPKDGDSVLVHGRVSVYEASGSYQIYVDSMELDGIGNLYVLYEQLKKKLHAEGLFNPEHKKKIRRVPRKIGVITASTGAAVRDIISTINKRFPMTEIYLFPTLVQGESAAPNIVKMIELANTYEDIDTIILGRGGGSIEDLWAFNEEIVARAIYNSRIPIISGVGHEIDFTISDFVADLRAPTPTGAAMLAVPDIEEVRRYFKNTLDKCNNSIVTILNNCTQTFLKYKTNYILNNPMKLYEIQEQKLDTLYDRLNISLRNTLMSSSILLERYKNHYIIKNPMVLFEDKKNKLEHLKTKAELLNPNNILDKGYSIVYKDNKVVKDITTLSKDDNINIMVKDGSINAKVEGINKNE